MAHDSDAFPFSTIKTDPALRWSLGISFAVLIAVIGVLLGFLISRTVFVDKLKDVAVVNEATAKRLQAIARPISQIKAVSDTASPVVLTGFAADVRAVCKAESASEPEDVILLAKQDSGFVAAPARLDKRTCGIFLSQQGNAPVWAVKDTEFTHTSSNPAYVVLNGPKNMVLGAQSLDLR
jgi:hypothetical protein